MTAVIYRNTFVLDDSADMTEEVFKLLPDILGLTISSHDMDSVPLHLTLGEDGWI
jgi:hypothetical protein